MPIPHRISLRSAGRVVALVILAALIASPPLGAQQAQGDTTRLVLNGLVTGPDGAPIAGAEVSRVVKQTVSRGVMTGPDGSFSLLGIAPGANTVVVRRLGYRVQSHTYDVQPGVQEAVEIRLDLARSRLDTFFVLAKRATDRNIEAFEAREKAGFGHFMNEAEVAKRNNEARVSDMLRQMPGVRILEPGPNSNTQRVRMRGSEQAAGGVCAPALFIDGMRFNNTEVDEVVTPFNVRAIEVYTNVATIPSEYSGSTSGCGVILIWQR